MKNTLSVRYRYITLFLLIGGVIGSSVHDAVAQSVPAEPQQLAHFDVMPKVLATAEGTLVSTIILHRGPGLEDTPQQQHLLIQQSTNGGKTWSDRQTVAKLPAKEGGFGFGAAMIDRDDEIHVFTLCDGNTGIVRARTKQGVSPVEPLPRQKMDVWHIRSSQGRKQWSTPKRIWKARAGDLVSAVQLRSGRILLPVCGFKNRSWRNRGEGFAAFTYLGSFDSTVIYSDDGGQTWNESPSILRTPTPTISTLGALEPVVVERNDGRVWMLIRTQLGVFYESFSKDGAEWSPPTPTNIVSSDSPAALVRLDEQRIVMIWNGCQRYPYALGGRHILHAAMTEDDGKTWKGYREILRDPHRNHPAPPWGDHGVAMPYTALLPDRTIVYSLWVQSGEGRSLFAFHPDWLTQTQQRDDFGSESLETWSIFGCQGVSVLSAEGAENGKALSIAKTDSQWPTGAVRNFPLGKQGKMTMRIKAASGAGPMYLVLTDHFSPPFDLEDIQNGVFSAVLGSADAKRDDAIKISSNRWSNLSLTWNTESGKCSLTLDGGKAVTLKARRTTSGLCYLRLRAPQTPSQAAGFLIDSIDVDVKR